MAKSLQGKKILIVYPPTEVGGVKNSLVYPMLENLTRLGANPTILDIDEPPTPSNIHLLDRLTNIWRRVFYRDIYFFNYVLIKHASRYYTSQLRSLTNKTIYDYVLVIRPDKFSPLFVKTLRRKSKVLSAYMWTAIKKGTEDNLRKTRKYYDNYFGFDAFEIEKYPELDWKFATNYFYHFDLISTQKIFDLTYIGSIYTNRRDLASYNLISKLTAVFNIKVFLGETAPPASHLIEDDRVQYLKKQIPYLEFVYESSKAKIVLDICKPEHTGLSFRYFEALPLNLKIVTNNTDIVNYDFYHPDNFYIIDYNDDTVNIEELKNWMQIPYYEIPHRIKKKYSFENWISYIFDLPGHIPITYNTGPQ